MADALILANNEFLPEDPNYEHGHDTRYRWVLDNHGYVHFGIVPDYSHWDILRQMDTQAPDVDAMGFYRPNDDKISVSENYTYDDIPTIAAKVRQAFESLVLHSSVGKITFGNVKVSANGWRKWVYDPDTDDYQEFEGDHQHWQIAQMIWPHKDISQGNWWGGSRLMRTKTGEPFLTATWIPSDYPSKNKTQIAAPEFILSKVPQDTQKISASNYFYIKSWMRPLTRWLYFPTQHILFARPFHDVYYSTHMQMFADVVEHYPNLANEPMEGGYVTSTGQVNVTLGEAANLEALGQALRAYNLEGQTAPLPH